MIHAETLSWQTLSETNNRTLHSTAMSPIANNRIVKSSSTFEKAVPKWLGILKHGSHISKMSMTVQEHVAPITPQIQVSKYFSSRFPANPRYFRLYSHLSHSLETWIIVSLEHRFVLLKMRASSKTKISCQTSNMPFKRRLYYLGASGFFSSHP